MMAAHVSPRVASCHRRLSLFCTKSAKTEWLHLGGPQYVSAQCDEFQVQVFRIVVLNADVQCACVQVCSVYVCSVQCAVSTVHCAGMQCLGVQYAFFLHPGLVYWDLTLAIFPVQARYNVTLFEKAEEVSW